MSEPAVHVYDEALQDANQWVKAVMGRMGTAEERVAAAALRSTFHALRDRIGPDNAVHLAAQLPTMLRGVYYEGWHPAGTPTRERREAEFLRHLEEDARTGPPFDPDRAARAVFDVMWEKVDPGEVTKVLHALPKELREFWPAVARADAEEREQDRG